MSTFPMFYDPADMTACFPADMSVRSINELTAPHALYFPFWVDDEQTPLAHMQAGGFASASHRFGKISDSVLGLNMILPGGAVVRQGGRTIKNCTGFDLTHFFLNSHQPVGQVTDIVVRLRTLAGPLKWFGYRMSAQKIEEFRRCLSRSPWWHVLECVDVEVSPDSLILWIGQRGSQQEQRCAEQWRNSLGLPFPVDATAPLPAALAADAEVKTLPSQAVDQAAALVSEQGGTARVHLTCGFFRWSSPCAENARESLNELQQTCLKQGGHVRSKYVSVQPRDEEVKWLGHMAEKWRELA